MGKKLESNFTNMVVVLFSVTLIASAAVGYVYSLTAGPIEAAKQAKQVNAIREVIPGEFDNDPNADVWKSQTADGGELEFYPAKKNGELIGTAVKTYTNNGFGGKIWLMVGSIRMVAIAIIRCWNTRNAGIRFQNGCMVHPQRERKYYG